MNKNDRRTNAVISIETLSEFKGTDLADICDATESTIVQDSLSFNVGVAKTKVPSREMLEKYWQGVLLVNERQLLVGRLDGTIASSIQILKPGRSNQTSRFAASVDHHFVAPWARGYGLAKLLIKTAEDEARSQGFSLLKLSVRSDLDAAVKLYEHMHYQKWGVLDKYEQIDGKMLAGYYYYKDL